MASPLKAGKQTVDLAEPRVSRIRRDPPPAVRKTVVPDREEVDRRAVAVGILAFALAILAVIAGVSSYNGWSPSEVTLEVRMQ
jgi:hypothetical protein